jgi:outer membrane protein assembly factor BamD (BamD/ComL family)
MNIQEKEALQRIQELLYDFPDERYTPHVTREDLETLVKLIEKSTKK